MSIKKKIISVVTAVACASTLLSFGVSSVNVYAFNDDEWNDWYSSLSDEEKKYVNYDPDKTTADTDEWHDWYNNLSDEEKKYVSYDPDRTTANDEWHDWYSSLSDEEKKYVNYDPNGNTACYSNFKSENTADKYKLKENGEKIYCIGSKGNFIIGWIEIGGNKYYFKKDGSAVRKSAVIDGIRYKFNSNGVYEGRYSGWVKKNGKYYYYKNGEIKKNCWLKVKGKRTYYLTEDGSRATGKVEIGGKTYNFSNDGKLINC